MLARLGVLALAALLLPGALRATDTAKDRRKLNILFIVVDDLNDRLSRPGHTQSTRRVDVKADAAPAKAQGAIILDGKPLAGATVTFHPVEKGGRPATGMTDDAGNYTLTTVRAGDGALPGRYKVTVSLSRGGTELIPPKYADKEKTALVVEITAEANQIDFALAGR